MTNELDDRELWVSLYWARFCEGDKTAPLKALKRCFKEGWTVPSWVRAAIVDAVKRVERYEGTWNDVFGDPHHGRKVTHLRREQKLRWEVFNGVMKLRRQKPKPKDIFLTVGNDLGIGERTCKRYFDDINKYLAEAKRQKRASK